MDTIKTTPGIRAGAGILPALTDEQIEAAVAAWFKEQIQPGRYPFAKRMRAAIAAATAANEPACWVDGGDLEQLAKLGMGGVLGWADNGGDPRRVPLYATPPDHTALMRQALEALENANLNDTMRNYALQCNAITALRAAIAGDFQAPVTAPSGAIKPTLYVRCIDGTYREAQPHEL